jgi:hypothetical protein
MKTIYPFSILCCALLFFACDLEKIDDGTPTPGGNASKFETSVGGNGNDFPNDVLAASDGGFVIVGYSQSFTPDNDNQAYIVKLDSKGKQSWDNHFGGKSSDYAEAVVQANDGGFVFCGRTQSFSATEDVFLVRVNASGVKVWDKFYGAADSLERAFGIVALSNGDFLVGYQSQKGTGTNNIRLMRINGNGSKISDKLVQTGGYNLTSMILSSDNKVVMAGSESKTNGTVTYIVKANEDGSFVWDNRFPAQASNYTPGYALVELPDKNIVIAGSDLGSNDHDFNLISYNQIGGKTWDFAWGGANADELFGIDKTKDGELIVMGYTGSFSGRSEFYLSKRKASDGSKIWEKNFVPIGNIWGDVATAADGGYIIVGGQNQANADILVVKTNEMGEYK